MKEAREINTKMFTFDLAIHKTFPIYELLKV